jgi:hypothetical protein
MKLYTVVILLAFASCNRASSPEGRSQLRDEKIQLQIDSLKEQQGALTDSLKVLSAELSRLRTS